MFTGGLNGFLRRVGMREFEDKDKEKNKDEDKEKNQDEDEEVGQIRGMSN